MTFCLTILKVSLLGILVLDLSFFSVYPINFRQGIFNLVSFFFRSTFRSYKLQSERQILLHFLSYKTKQVQNEDCQQGDLQFLLSNFIFPFKPHLKFMGKGYVKDSATEFKLPNEMKFDHRYRICIEGSIDSSCQRTETSCVYIRVPRPKKYQLSKFVYKSVCFFGIKSIQIDRFSIIFGIWSRYQFKFNGILELFGTIYKRSCQNESKRSKFWSKMEKN